MIFRKNAVIEMNGKLMKLNENNICEDINYFESNNKLNVITDIKHRNLYIIIDGNEIYVKHMSIPVVKKDKIEKIIYNELKYYIHNMDNVIFSYEVNSVQDKMQNISVFCLNWSRLKILRYLAENGNRIKAVYMIQFCFLSYFKSVIVSSRFIFIFEYNSKMYLMYCKESSMCGNRIIETVNDENVMQSIINFISEVHDEYKDDNVNDIYVANSCMCCTLKEHLAKYNIIELGSISKEKIIKSIM